MQEVFKQPSPQHSYSTLRKTPLGSPNRLMLKKCWILNWPLAIRASIIRTRELWSFVFSKTASFASELNLISNCVLQALEVFRHGFQSKSCIRSCIAKPRNRFKWSYNCLQLLIVLLVPPVNLIYKKYI